VEVEARVPENSIASLRAGVDVRLEFDAAPGQAWIGTLARVVPQADLLSRSFPVRIVLENRIIDGEPVLRGGMLARAWLPVGRDETVTVVPKDALVLGGPRPLVFAVEPGAAPGTGTVQPVDVVLGAAIGGSVEIRGGLTPGRLVVIRGNERLRPGTPVTFSPLRD